MTEIRIVQHVDGEELVSFESAEPRGASVMDDPRRGALERRGAAELSARRAADPSARRSRPA